MCKKPLNRRDFLKSMGLGVGIAVASDPILMMLEQIIHSKRYMAEAATVSASTLNRFIMIKMAGAPARWHYDLFLNPYSADSTIYRNQYVATRFTSTGDLAYQTIPYRGINVPYFWGTQMPLAAGGTAPMTNLIDNGMFIRGIAMPDDAHTSNQARLLSPAQTEPSIPTLIQKNSSQIVTNPALTSSLSSVLSNLTTSGNNFVYRNKTDYTSVQGAMNAAVQTMTDHAKTTTASTSTVFDQFKTVDAQLNSTFFANLDSLISNFATVRAKYQALLDAVKNQNNFPVTGLTTKQALAAKNPKWAQVSDPALISFSNSDMSSIMGKSATGVDDFGYANQFAVTEVLMKAGLTQYCNINSGGINNMTYDSLTDSTGAAASGETYWGFDEHGSTPATILLVGGYHFRAFNACLNELIIQLKSANIFDKTVIMVGSEFNRRGADNNGDTAYTDASHQGYGNSFAFYSGMVTAPICLGNIQSFNFDYMGSHSTASNAATLSQTQRGTTGWAGMTALGDRTDILSFKEFSSTVCEMIGIPKLFNNFDPIVKVQNGKFVPQIDKAQNVSPV